LSVGYQRSAGPASDEDIQRLERHIGRPLPDAYRAYLRQQDGGRLETNHEAANEVFGVGPDTPEWADMWRFLDLYKDRVPAWLLPVAADSFGNLFALSLRDSDRGSVWFWDHEREADEDEPPAEDNIERRAPDWRAFLDSLRPPDLSGIDLDDVEIV
jgi:hypothetical protein